jgi:hypothetical protein
MTRLIICDVGLLYMWKVIVYVYAAISVCLFLSLPGRGGKQNRQKKLKQNSYLPQLCSSV